MSALPNAVYATAAMTAEGKTLVIASSGTAFGNYARTRKLASVTVSDYRQVAFPLSGSSALPNAAYATAAMTTSGKTLVIASSGASFGQYARIYGLAALLDRVIGQAGSETAPAGTVSATGLERFIGSGAEAAPAALIDGSGSVSGAFHGSASETAPPGLISATGIERYIGSATETPPAALTDGAGFVYGAFHGTAWEIAPPGLIGATGHVGAGLGGSSRAGVTQVLIEVAAHGEQGAAPPSLVITQDVIEWALHPGNMLTVTQDVIEWALHPANALRVTQSCIEVAYKGRRQPKVIARYQRALP